MAIQNLLDHIVDRRKVRPSTARGARGRRNFVFDLGLNLRLIFSRNALAGEEAGQIFLKPSVVTNMLASIGKAHLARKTAGTNAPN